MKSWDFFFAISEIWHFLATMIRGGKTFYAPWCTGQHNEALKYVLHCAATVISGLHVRLV